MGTLPTPFGDVVAHCILAHQRIRRFRVGRLELDFDMMRRRYELLDIDSIITKCICCLPLSCSEGTFKSGGVFDKPHAFTASAGRRLQHDRKANTVCHLERLGDC